MNSSKESNLKLTAKESIHFQGFTELRGIAALTVVISHIDQFGYLFQIPSYNISKTGIAGHAVTLFFVLSGFLITYLLLIEKRDFNKINIRKFYFRRIFRIWPAYFVTILLALLVALFGITRLSLETFAKGGVLFAFFLPNLAYVLGLTFGGTSPLWSIGVEEQFYLIWPWLVDKTKSLVKWLIVIIVIYLILKIGVYLIHPTGGLYALVKLTRFDCMALGGLAAWVLSTRNFLVPTFAHKGVQLTCYLILFAPFSNKFSFFAQLEIELYAIACTVLIFNCANGTSLVKIHSSALRWIGDISYGLYVYHLIIIYVVAHLGFTKNIGILTFTAVILLTVIFARVSFLLLEKPFLRFKRHYSLVKSNA